MISEGSRDTKKLIEKWIDEEKKTALPSQV